MLTGSWKISRQTRPIISSQTRKPWKTANPVMLVGCVFHTALAEREVGLCRGLRVWATETVQAENISCLAQFWPPKTKRHSVRAQKNPTLANGSGNGSDSRSAMGKRFSSWNCGNFRKNKHREQKKSRVLVKSQTEHVFKLHWAKLYAWRKEIDHRGIKISNH